MMTLQLMTLTGKFRLEREIQVADSKDALAAAIAHATSGGYTNVKPVQDVDSIRYTARTPGGRGGRNVAFLNFPDYPPELEPIAPPHQRLSCGCCTGDGTGRSNWQGNDRCVCVNHQDIPRGEPMRACRFHSPEKPA